MHPAWLRCENSEYTQYSCAFASCQTGDSTLKIANLFLREPLPGETGRQIRKRFYARIHPINP